ncbi:MAG TPA: hypothetical protein VIU93_11275 [Gallionellaceae bacterium]
MPLNETQLSAIQSSVAYLLARGEPLVAELRRKFPEVTFVRCPQEDMEGQPYLAGDGYQLYLINRSAVCIAVTDSPDQADGVVIAS